MIPLAIVIAVLGLVAASGQGFFLRGERLSGKDLAQRRPDLSWVRWGFPLIKALWIFCVVCPVLVLLMTVSPDCARPWGDYFEGTLFSRLAVTGGILGMFFSGLTVPGSVLGILTGVYSSEFRIAPFYYYVDKPRLIGLVQLCLVLVVIAVLIPWFVLVCTSGSV